MADLFLSFKTSDTDRVRLLYNGFKERGLAVFWSNDIPTGSSDYQAIIRAEIRSATIVIVAWTHASVESNAVAQECSQAERDNKLIQVVLDDIAPIDFPFEARFKSQKAMMVGWTGELENHEWRKLNESIDLRLGRNIALTSTSDRMEFPRSTSSPQLLNMLAPLFERLAEDRQDPEMAYSSDGMRSQVKCKTDLVKMAKELEAKAASLPDGSVDQARLKNKAHLAAGLAARRDLMDSTKSVESNAPIMTQRRYSKDELKVIGMQIHLKRLADKAVSDPNRVTDSEWVDLLEMEEQLVGTESPQKPPK